MLSSREKIRTVPLVSMALASFLAPYANGYDLINTEQSYLSLDLEGGFGTFHSQENYSPAGTRVEGSSSWQEAYLKYGFSGSQQVSSSGDRIYGGLNWLSSGTFGDGDASGFSDGSERTTKIEDAFLGWKSGGIFPSLGQDGVDFSFGRQKITIGDGFLISSDGLNIGRGVAGDRLNRGGTYYLASRKAFDQTAVLRLGGAEGVRSDLIWMKSDNRAQGKAEMVAGTLENVTEKGTLGLTYVDVVDTDPEWDLIGRDGTKNVSVRGQGNAGIKDLSLSGEYVWQDRPSGRENAWYAEAGWTFSDLPLSPNLFYRYSRFSNGYDPMFYGNDVRGLGAWFQGEVAGNYAGPFNSNLTVDNVGLRLYAREDLSFGALAYRFRTLDRTPSGGGFFNGDGKELDIYAQWAVTENILLIPLVGFYKPEADAAHGGTQIGDNGTNVYGEFLVFVNF